MIEHVENPGQGLYSPAKIFGMKLAEEFKKDSHFYFFSPDETTSNKFDEIFDVEKRAWGNLEIKPGDLPESANGRIVEMLSENVLFSAMTGHLMNGEKAMMGSYEAFYSIIASQLLQQIKFIKQTKETMFRSPIPAVNLLSTSTCWRQDHNGYTHQSPALISTLLSVPSNLVNCFFPVDDVAAEVVYDYMINSENVVNFTTFNKVDEPRYIDSRHAKFQIENGGASVFGFASEENPDFILTAAGDIATKQALDAIEILKTDMAEIRFRFVGIGVLSYGAIGTTDNKLSQESFDDMFTTDKYIIANFHGYPETLRSILENYSEKWRIKVHGFNEEGSTTTPFEMLRRNHASCYDLASDVAEICGRMDLVHKYHQILEENHAHAVKFGEDLIQ